MWQFFKKKTIEEKIGEKIKSEAPDFSRLFGNLSSRDEADALYKELSALLHPDRFVGADKKTIELAENLFKELQNCRTDIRLLRIVKEKASHLYLNKEMSL